jgi:hypothetical protein
MAVVVVPNLVVGGIFAWHRGEQRLGEDPQKVGGWLVQGDGEGMGIGGGQARDAAGLAGAERSGPGDEVRVLLPARGVVLVVEPLDGGDEVGGGDLAVDWGGVADPGAQGEGVDAPVSRDLGWAAGDVGDRDGLLLGRPGEVVAVQSPGVGRAIARPSGV